MRWATKSAPYASGYSRSQSAAVNSRSTVCTSRKQVRSRERIAVRGAPGLSSASVSRCGGAGSRPSVSGARIASAQTRWQRHARSPCPGCSGTARARAAAAWPTQAGQAPQAPSSGRARPPERTATHQASQGWRRTGNAAGLAESAASSARPRTAASRSRPIPGAGTGAVTAAPPRRWRRIRPTPRASAPAARRRGRRCRSAGRVLGRGRRPGPRCWCPRSAAVTPTPWGG